MSDYDSLETGSDAVTRSSWNDAAEPFPWPPAEGESIISAFGRTWQGAALKPRDFFSRLPESGSLGAAVLYYLAIGIAAAGAMLFVRTLQGPPDASAGGLLAELGMTGAWNPLLDFLLSPVMLLLSLFVSAAATHLMLKMVGGANRPYTFTVRVFAFAYSPQILGLVPYLGTVAGFVWMVIVAVIGLSAGHRTSMGRAAAAVLVPLAVALVFVALALITAAVVTFGGVTR